MKKKKIHYRLVLLHFLLINGFSLGLLLLLNACNPQKNTPPTETPSKLPTAFSTPLPTINPTPTESHSFFSNRDGMIAFTSLERNEWQVYIVNTNSLDKLKITADVRGGYEPNWSPDGTRLVFQYNGLWIADIINNEITRIPLSVKSNDLPNEYLVKPSWSPDGDWIAFLNENGTQGDIYLIRPDGTELKRLTDTNDISRDGNLVWSPDGKQLAYSGYRDRNIEIYILNVVDTLQGGITRQQLTDSLAPVRNLVTSWSHDGARLAFSSDRDGNMEIYLMEPDGSNPVQLTHNPASDSEANWSPDGRSITFISDRDGNVEIYVMDVEDALQSREDARIRRMTFIPGDDMGPVWRPAP